MVKFAEEKLLERKRTVREIVEEIYRLIEEQGLEVLTGKDLPGNLGIPRKEELYACIDGTGDCACKIPRGGSPKKTEHRRSMDNYESDRRKCPAHTA